MPGGALHPACLMPSLSLPDACTSAGTDAVWDGLTENPIHAHFISGLRSFQRLFGGGAGDYRYACEMHTVADQKRLTHPAYHQRWEASLARAGGGHLIWLGAMRCGG
jgi:hypothetical protein